MNYTDIYKTDTTNGKGIRVVLWTSGCSHHCKNCHNQQTWNPNYGHKFTDETKKELFDAISKPYIDGITFSGGDPLFETNTHPVTELAKEIKELYPNKTIWLYSGYLWEDVKDLEIMKYTDVFIDGEFMQELRNITLLYRGSENQRVIDVQKSLSSDKVVLYVDDSEHFQKNKRNED